MLLACSTLTIAAALTLAVPGCSKDDAATTDTMDGATEAAVPDPCDLNTFFDAGGSGGPCFPVSTMACFPQCLTGGCTCTRNPAGGDHGIWKCVTDNSCYPDARPFDDDSGPNLDASDGSADDGSLDAGIDADDAG